MPDTAGAWERAKRFWGAIEYAAQTGMTTADLWANIREAALEQDLASPGVTVQDVSVLRGVAGRIVGTGRQLQDAPGNRVVSGRYVAEAPWARSPGARKAAPEWHFRFLHTVEQDGEQIQQWRTVRFQGQRPRTVAELLSAAEEDADHLADEYGQTHVGIADWQLLEV